MSESQPRTRRPQVRRAGDSREDILRSSHRLFGRLGDEEMRYILVHLTEEQPGIRKRVKHLQQEFAEVLRGRMKGVDAQEVASDVLSDLNALEPETLWDSTGSDRHGGYYAEDEASWDMFSDEMDGSVTYLEDLWKEGLRQDAAAYCLGLLWGLARFKVEGKKEPREWFGENAYSCARDVLEKWNKMTRGGRWLHWVLDRIPQTLPPEFLQYFRPEKELGIAATAAEASDLVKTPSPVERAREVSRNPE